MATEVVTVVDPVGWVAFASAACVAVAMTWMYFKKASPTGPFQAFFTAKSKNRENGGEKSGKFVVLILLDPASRLIELECAKRSGGILIRKNHEGVHLARPNTLWFLAGIPVAFVWSNNWRIINPAAAAATVQHAEQNGCATRDEVIDAIKQDKSHENVTLENGIVVPFAEMVAFNDDCSPADMDSIAQWLINESKRKPSLLDILKNPKALLAIVIIICAIPLIFSLKG